MTAPALAGPPKPAHTPRRERWLVAAIALAAFALRLIHLGRDSLWYDETVSVYLAGQPAAELIAHTARDIHPPLYYLLLRGWLLLAGYPTGQADPAGPGLEFMAAFLSLFVGVLLVPLTWQLARRLGLRQPVPLLAALLIALSPFGVWYSQEVRMYTLGAALGVVVLLTTLPFLRRESSTAGLRRAALLYALAAAAGMVTLYYFAFLLVSLNLLVIVGLARRLRPTAESAESTEDRIDSPTAESAESTENRIDGPTAESAESTENRIDSLTAESTKDRINSLTTESTRASNCASPQASPVTCFALWLAAQAGALLLFLPWLPIAWRQATNPPVPPWRAAPQLLEAIVESWTALAFGQSANPTRFWPLLLLSLALVATGIIASRRAHTDSHQSPFTIHQSTVLLVAGFGPLLLILLASLATPLYHVRYLFTYSPPFSILLATGLAALWSWRHPIGRWLAGLALTLLILGSALSLRVLWIDPAFTADDHRAAVRELAQRWRPGDVILVNAGYAYPALLTYWPGPIAWHGRLSDFTQDIAARAAAQHGVVVLQTGHIDGDPAIGWGDPRSDFYALPQAAMQTALRDLSGQTDRLWHYRIYDTVNDPAGALRDEMAAGWTLVDDRVYSGEANLRVQGWQGVRPLLSSYLPPVAAVFDNWLELRLAPDMLPAAVESGAALEIPRALWSRDPAQAGRPVALSLRLVDAAGQVWAAQDEPLGGNVLDLASASQLVQPLRLAVPAGTAPGLYDLALVVYDPQTGQALTGATPLGESGSLAVLGQVEVTRPAQSPDAQPAQADFGPLRLVQAATAATAISPGDAIPVDLLWQAAPDFQAAPLVVVVQLLDEAGQVVASLEAEPLDGRYPSSQWQPGELVRDRHTLAVPANTAPGQHQLIVGLYHAADGQRLTTRSGLLGLTKQGHFPVQTIDVR
jgi:hypothetical protein